MGKKVVVLSSTNYSFYPEVRRLLRSSYLRDHWAAIFGHLSVLFRQQNLDVPRWVRLRFYRRKTPQICTKSTLPTSLLNMNSLVSHPEEIFFRLKDLQWKPEKDKGTLKTLAAAFIESCFVSGAGSPASPFPSEAKSGGKNCSAAIERFLRSMDQFKLRPSAFALEP